MSGASNMKTFLALIVGILLAVNSNVANAKDSKAAADLKAKSAKLKAEHKKANDTRAKMEAEQAKQDQVLNDLRGEVAGTEERLKITYEEVESLRKSDKRQKEDL